MFSLRLVVAVLLAVMLSGPAFAGVAAPLHSPYRRPRLTVPYAWTKPVLDGVVEDAEWRGAASWQALLTVRQRFSRRQTRFWCCWDEEHLYLAMRSPLRPGELPVQRHAESEGDADLAGDDAFGLWLDAGGVDPETGLRSLVQFVANAAGARLDRLHLPMRGTARRVFDTGWEVRQRVSPGHAWEWELAITRRTLQRADPFRSGSALSLLLARNYQRPWEQCSFAGAPVFNNPPLYTRLTLSRSAPALHFLLVGRPESRHFGLALRARAQPRSRGAGAPRQLVWRYTDDGGAERAGMLDVSASPAGASLALEDVAECGPGRCRFTVRGKDGGAVWLDWAAVHAFEPELAGTWPEVLDDGERGLVLDARFDPLGNVLRPVAESLVPGPRRALATLSVSVLSAAGQPLVEAECTPRPPPRPAATVPLAELAPGQYRVRLSGRNAEGQVLAAREVLFEKKDHAKVFPWWRTPHGRLDRVPAPWTPVQRRGDQFAVWGRRYRAGTAGLPASIVSRERELLAGPVALVAEAAEAGLLELEVVPGRPEVVFAEPCRQTLRWRGRLGPLAVTGEVSVEFDGLYRIELVLEPPEAWPTVERVQLRVPLRAAMAQQLHACGSGSRTGYAYGPVPPGEGRVWDCRAVYSQPMVKGSFIPYLWVGGPRGGLAWFADSDAGWVQAQDVPAIALRREGPGTVVLVLNLVGETCVLSAPRTFVFAFQATPVKPQRPGWRRDPWWMGDSLFDSTGSASDGQAPPGVPFSPDAAGERARVEARHAESNAVCFGLPSYPARVIPYLDHLHLPAARCAEVAYFGEAWRSSRTDALCYNRESLADYLVHHLAERARTTGIDGVYLDRLWPVASADLHAGRGYLLPDGRVQPTYALFATRRYLLRLRAAFAEAGRTGGLVFHMTNHFIAPWLGAADVVCDGAQFPLFAGEGYDFMDKWSVERLQLAAGRQWGVAVNLLSQYQGPWPDAPLAKAFRAYTGAAILHDALPSGNAGGANVPLWVGRERFGIGAEDVTFIGDGEEPAALRCAAPGVRLAAWLRPGRLLLAVVNRGRGVNARVEVDGRALRLPAPRRWIVRDAEAGTSVSGRVTGGVCWSAAEELAIVDAGNGVIAVPVKRHDYRLVYIGSPEHWPGH